MKQKILVTGGAGFIGSTLCRHLVNDLGHSVINVDKLTYAADLRSLESIAGSNHYRFEKVDICDEVAMAKVFEMHQPNAVIHLAAESHVDRSIDNPESFIQTNIVGTYRLLEVARSYWNSLSDEREKSTFRFLHVSTDEVFGSLDDTEMFTEKTAYNPNSPYSASKAASDHLVRSWHKTFGLPILLSNCSNNYGPFQFPEKLIPLMIINSLTGRELPVYGTGKNKRDWLHVEDHARALSLVLLKGVIGESYNIGGHNEIQNLEVVRTICDLVDEISPQDRNRRSRDLITYVPDRPGHDWRYAIDSSKLSRELGWSPQYNFANGIRQTVTWYLNNQEWWQPILDGKYQGERLGKSV